MEESANCYVARTKLRQSSNLPSYRTGTNGTYFPQGESQQFVPKVLPGKYSVAGYETNLNSDVSGEYNSTRLAGIHPSHLFNGGRPMSAHVTSVSASPIGANPTNGSSRIGTSSTNQIPPLTSASGVTLRSSCSSSRTSNPGSASSSGVVLRKPKETSQSSNTLSQSSMTSSTKPQMYTATATTSTSSRFLIKLLSLAIIRCVN